MKAVNYQLLSRIIAFIYMENDVGFSRSFVLHVSGVFR